MAEPVFLFLCLIVVFALAMRRAPLWLWAASLAAATPDLADGAAARPLRGAATSRCCRLLAWMPVVVLAGLSIPPLRRAALIEPIFRKIKGILPKVSATEQEALNAGTIGFDAELFSGTPDWEKLRAVPPITLTDGGEGVPRRADGRAVPHGRRLEDPPQPARDPRADLGLRQEARLPRHADLQGARRPGLLGAGAVAGAGQDRLALARRVHARDGAELAGPGRADREIRHARAEGALPAAPRQGPGGAVLLADRADLGLGCRHHARRRLRHARAATRART